MVFLSSFVAEEKSRSMARREFGSVDVCASCAQVSLKRSNKRRWTCQCLKQVQRMKEWLTVYDKKRGESPEGRSASNNVVVNSALSARVPVNVRFPPPL